jgi:dTDP-4-dehydrorhamnose reductase
MKIFIFGSNGMLGTYVKIYLSKYYDVVPLTRNDYDISKITIDTLKELLISKHISNNDVIINCAGVIPQSTKLNILSTKLYITVNTMFPIILSMLCDEFNCKFIHITTDCVFSGDNGHYNENSIHDETNIYGTSKSLGEACNGTIIRTSIIGEEIHNKYSLLEWVKSNYGQTINGYNNHLWNGVTCLELSKIICKIISNKMFWNGVRHIFSPRIISKYELVTIINDIYGLKINIYNIKEDKSIDKSLTSIYEKIFDVPDIIEQIKELKNFNIK